MENQAAAIRRQTHETVSIYRRKYMRSKRIIDNKGAKFRTVFLAGVPEVKSLMSRFKQAHRIPDANEALDEFNAVFNLEAYYKLQSVNSLVCNADHIDELYLYEVREDPRKFGKLYPMGWDFEPQGIVNMITTLKRLGYCTLGIWRSLRGISDMMDSLERQYDSELRELHDYFDEIFQSNIYHEI